MRKLLLSTLILLVSAGWAVAQNPNSPPMSENPGVQSPSTPGSQPGMTGQQQPGMPGQAGQQQPGAPGQVGQQPGTPGQTGEQPGIPSAQTGQEGQESSPAEAGNTVEGCLGGSAGNFNITSKSGIIYRLDIPTGADTSKLSQHVGEEVRVTGTTHETGAAGSSDTTSASSASAGTPGAGAGAAGSAGGPAVEPSIAVTKIDKISNTCTGKATKPNSRQ